MYELVQVAENTYYINAPSKIGVYRVSDDDVWLIDSGNDKDAGRKIQKILDAQGWKLTAIINTHSNADHDGGNTLLQNRLNCAVYTTPMELAIVEHPMLEPSFLYGGYPFKKLAEAVRAAVAHVIDAQVGVEVARVDVCIDGLVFPKE